MRESGCSIWEGFRRAAITLVVMVLLGGCTVEDLKADDWDTPGELRGRLASPVNSIVWSGNPLRAALRSLSRTHRVATLLDRRVDPGRKLKLRLREMTLEEALHEIARREKLGVTIFGPVAYFGPPEVTSRLHTLAELRNDEIRRLSADVRRKFLLPKSLSWSHLATPRSVLGALAKQNGLKIANLDRVPHDLWASADLPPLSLVERLTLILVQFDLTFEISPEGDTVSLRAVADEVALVRSYPGGRDPQATAKTFASLVPNARVKVVGNKVYVKGLWEDHQRLTSRRRSPKRSPSQPADQRFSNKRFTLKVEAQPIGALLKELAGNWQLDLQIDHQALEEAGISLQQRVSFEMENVSVDELLGEAVKSTGLSFRRRGNVLEIGPGE